VCVTQQNLCAHTTLQKSKFSAEDSYQYLVVYEVWLSTWYAYVLGQGTFKTNFSMLEGFRIFHKLYYVILAKFWPNAGQMPKCALHFVFFFKDS